MASGILDRMEGKLGHAAWRSVDNFGQRTSLTHHRWLFYIEGALTVFIAIVAIFVLPDFPETTRWLSPQERALAILRMEEDGATQEDDEEKDASHARGLWLAVTDWKVWWLSLALTSEVVALSFNAYFPTLAATMGFNRTITLVLCAPPFIFAAIFAFVLSRCVPQDGDRTRLTDCQTLG